MYLALASIVLRFDFRFEKGTSGADFECESDQFAIRTKGGDVLNAYVKEITSS
jgi:hypothetical protein